jgi:hypothetical protein
VLLLVLIHQTAAFHSSFLLSFSPQTAESLLTLLLFIPVTAGLFTPHTTAPPLHAAAFTRLSASFHSSN